MWSKEHLFKRWNRYMDNIDHSIHFKRIRKFQNDRGWKALFKIFKLKNFNLFIYCTICAVVVAVVKVTLSSIIKNAFIDTKKSEMEYR